MKHLRYLRYVLRHKYYVWRACLAYGLWWQGLIHDWSKFTPAEWGPYADYFYGAWRTRSGPVPHRIHLAFDMAWNHHQKVNPHHWQYWLLCKDDGRMVVLPMPDRYRKEMLADWRGAGQAQGKPDTAAWYQRNARQIMLHPDTEDWVRRELGVRNVT